MSFSCWSGHKEKNCDMPTHTYTHTNNPQDLKNEKKIQYFFNYLFWLFFFMLIKTQNEFKICKHKDKKKCTAYKKKCELYLFIYYVSC
jgi:hypothetical protein